MKTNKYILGLAGILLLSGITTSCLSDKDFLTEGERARRAAMESIAETSANPWA